MTWYMIVLWASFAVFAIAQILTCFLSRHIAVRLLPPIVATLICFVGICSYLVVAVGDVRNFTYTLVAFALWNVTVLAVLGIALGWLAWLTVWVIRRIVQKRQQEAEK